MVRRESAGSSANKRVSKLKLMIVDDEKDITTVLKRGLEQYGFDVDTFNDPLKVISGYKPGSYDLLLLDVRMPGMSGFELCRKLRDIDKDVRVCFLTAFEIYYDEFRRVFPKLHVRCFARKPITPAELKKIILDEMKTKK